MPVTNVTAFCSCEAFAFVELMDTPRLRIGVRKFLAKEGVRVFRVRVSKPPPLYAKHSYSFGNSTLRSAAYRGNSSKSAGLHHRRMADLAIQPTGRA
jgi:hypothetical protein